MRFVFLIIMFIHGLIHLLGFVKAFHIAPVEQLTKNISKPLGALWLVTTVLFLATFALYFKERESWWIIGLLSIVTSQVLIISSWSDARYGTAANVILLIPVIIAFAESRPTSFQNVFKNQVELGLTRMSAQPIMTEKDIEHLPGPVQKYLRYFNEKGELINFASDDRYESADGKVYNNYRWTTPLKEYKEFDGRMATSYGEAIWHKPEGEFCYARFNLEEIEYNCKKYNP
ncbi:hypothetical protein JXO59_14890 [candidate division KSB1 bacterium]|nr:hypothetical protein [candidate division KSB1 bacterium]